MAFVTEITCKRCGRTKTEVVDHSNTCAECRATEAAIKKKAHLESLASLPLERRIALLEEQAYDTNAAKRLSALESTHARY